MNWIQRKIYLYNVTFGFYMLDWWECYLFSRYVGACVGVVRFLQRVAIHNRVLQEVIMSVTLVPNVVYVSSARGIYGETLTR
ncbi:hypothetical protein LINGRAHAP2_LOCUS8793 [Linum grandiflorum]